MKCVWVFSAAWARHLVSLKTSHLDSEVQVYNLVFSDSDPGQGAAEQWRQQAQLCGVFYPQCCPGLYFNQRN